MLEFLGFQTINHLKSESLLYRDTCSNTLNRSPGSPALLSRQLVLSEQLAILSKQQLRKLGYLA